MIVYTKLWLKLAEQGKKRTDLLEIISSATLAKLGKNEPVSMKVIGNICDYLDCQPGDIMENITKEKIIEVGSQFNAQMGELLKNLAIATGQTEQELIAEFAKEAPAFIEKLASGNRDFFGIAEIEKLSK